MAKEYGIYELTYHPKIIVKEKCEILFIRK